MRHECVMRNQLRDEVTDDLTAEQERRFIEMFVIDALKTNLLDCDYKPWRVSDRLRHEIDSGSLSRRRFANVARGQGRLLKSASWARRWLTACLTSAARTFSSFSRIKSAKTTLTRCARRRFAAKTLARSISSWRGRRILKFTTRRSLALDKVRCRCRKCRWRIA